MVNGILSPLPNLEKTGVSEPFNEQCLTKSFDKYRVNGKHGAHWQRELT